LTYSIALRDTILHFKDLCVLQLSLKGGKRKMTPETSGDDFVEVHPHSILCKGKVEATFTYILSRPTNTDSKM
jgi:hypothetical protein